MDTTNITDFISQVGFPIAMCIGLLWYMNKQQNNSKEEIDELKTVISELKYAITNLCTLIGGSKSTEDK